MTMSFRMTAVMTVAISPWLSLAIGADREKVVGITDAIVFR
jgi:hypothetical protein